MTDGPVETVREADFDADKKILSHVDNSFYMAAREWKALPYFTREMIVEPLTRGCVLVFSKKRQAISYDVSTYVYAYTRQEEFRFARFLLPCRLGRGQWWCYNKGGAGVIRMRDPFNATVSSREGFLALGHDGLQSPFVLEGLRGIGATPEDPAARVVAPRWGADYDKARNGRLYLIGEASRTGQTSYSALAPMIALYTAAPGNRRKVLRSLRLKQVGSVAGGDISIRFAVEPSNLYLSGGTVVTPVCLTGDMQATASPDFVVKSNPTLSSGSLVLSPVRTIPAGVGAEEEFDLEDLVQIGKAGTLCVFAWAATTGPTFEWNAEVVEET